MNLNEIKKKKWEIDKNFKKIISHVNHIPIEEQECLLNIDRYDQKIHVDCTYPTYILKLSRSSFFTLESLLVSDRTTPNNYVLGVQGILDINGISIRKNKRKYTKTQRLDMLNKMKKMRNCKK